MSQRRALMGVLAIAVALALTLTGCTNRPAPDPATTRAAAPATSVTTPQAAGCPLGDARCPRPRVTPGAVIPSDAGVCQTTYNPRKYLTAAAKRRVLAAYGLPPDTKVVEWDHLVARWAGGTSTSSNMWPILTDRERDRKNRLGFRLYVQVCRDKTLGLAEARQRMREFWKWY